MKILDADQTRAHLNFERLVPALRAAFAPKRRCRRAMSMRSARATTGAPC